MVVRLTYKGGGTQIITHVLRTIKFKRKTKNVKDVKKERERRKREPS